MIENIFKDHKDLYYIHIESNLTFIKACKIIRDTFPGFEINFIIKFQVNTTDLIYNIEINNIHAGTINSGYFSNPNTSFHYEKFKRSILTMTITNIMRSFNSRTSEIRNDSNGRWLNI